MGFFPVIPSFFGAKKGKVTVSVTLLLFSCSLLNRYYFRTRKEIKSETIMMFLIFLLMNGCED